MSDSEKKIKAPLLHSAKSRVFIALGLIVIGIAAIAFIVHWRSNVAATAASAGVSGAPSISSIPGAGNPSAAYVKAQTEANAAGEAAARKVASSYVPTVTRAGFVGNPDQFGQISSDSNTGPSQCPLSKTVVMYKPNPANCTPENLKLARESGVTAEELLCQGCACPLLKDAGYSIGDLKGVGLSATQLRACGFTLQELVHAGFSAADLRNAGFSAQDLKNAGFTAGELKSAGFSATDLKAAGFSAADLKNAGFTASALKAARFSARAVREAVFTAGQLKTAGFTAKELHDAGFSARQLKNAGYSATELKNAGFSAADLKDAGFSAGALKSAGFSARQLAAAGFTAKQLAKAGYSAADLKNAGFSAADLKAAGFTKGDLLRAGFNAAESGYRETPQTEQTQTASDNAATNTLLPPINANSPEAKLAQFEKQQQADMNAQQKADEIQRLQGSMNQQANKFLVGWSNFALQQLQNAPETKSESGGSNAANAASAAAAAALHGPILKAGTVLFAVIETSINSDENTPIMAHIVSGPLKGSKLLGSFSRQHKRLLITFAMLNDPQYPNSIGINAVAIDPDTARTAISGQVDSHYMLRYGTLFAASFLQGISEGIMNQGVTSDCLFGGFGCTLQQNPLSTNQQIAVGLGKVGQAYSQEMGQNFNRAPTVRIASGTGIGVLLMGDLTLPV